MVIGSVYRPPSADSQYYDNMVDVIDHFANNDDHLIVIGDLNIDCSNENTNDSNARIDFIEQITGLRQIVNEPTRVTLTTSTLIDVIFYQ